MQKRAFHFLSACLSACLPASLPLLSIPLPSVAVRLTSCLSIFLCPSLPSSMNHTTIICHKTRRTDGKRRRRLSFRHLIPLILSRRKICLMMLRGRRVRTLEIGNRSTRTVLVLRMAHRKWKEFKQQPSMLPGSAVPGSWLVSFYFLWAILSTSSVLFFFL